MAQDGNGLGGVPLVFPAALLKVGLFLAVAVWGFAEATVLLQEWMERRRARGYLPPALDLAEALLPPAALDPQSPPGAPPEVRS